MNSKTFTFKKTKFEGRYRTFNAEHHSIKHDGKAVGWISEHREFGSAPSELQGKLEGKFLIYLSIKRTPTEGAPCTFRNVRLKKVCNSAEEAREWLKSTAVAILSKYDLHHHDSEI